MTNKISVTNTRSQNNTAQVNNYDVNHINIVNGNFEIQGVLEN